MRMAMIACMRLTSSLAWSSAAWAEASSAGAFSDVQVTVDRPGARAFATRPMWRARSGRCFGPIAPWPLWLDVCVCWGGLWLFD